MRYMFLMLLLACLSLTAINNDKEWHFAAGAIISVTTQEFMYSKTNDEPLSFISGQVVAITAGMLKESYDSAIGHKFNGVDWEYTCIGAMCAMPVNFIFNRAFLHAYEKEKRKDAEYFEKIKNRWR